MADSWYYSDKNGAIGPFTLQELRETLVTIPNASIVLVWRNGFSGWKLAKDVVELGWQTTPPLVSSIEIGNPEPHADAQTSTSQHQTPVVGIVGTGLGLASVVVPYFAAVFFAPAALICSVISLARHEKGWGRPGYEDWCLLDGSWALDPLNAFAVAGPVTSAHDAAAAQMEEGHGGLYALVWGEPVLPERSTAVWLTRPRGIQWLPVLDTLRQQLPQTTLWRRQMVLGPGKEFALIVPPGVTVVAPAGWSALAIERVRVDAPSS